MYLIPFQFHKGTIRTTKMAQALDLVAYFNSIKVRLEQRMERRKDRRTIFQFHKGTIRTYKP